MRSFNDRDGRRWELVLGRESWGRIVALLYPRDGPGPVLQAALEAPGYREAETALQEMDLEALRTLLGRAEPRDGDDQDRREGGETEP